MGKFIDLTGQQFNKWRVLEYKGNSQWLCECQCENHTLQILNGYTLKNGKSKGCRKCASKNNSNIIDIKGETFGELTVIEYNTETSMWKCKCSCGAFKEVRGYDLTRGNTKSCGDRSKHSYRPSNFVNLVGKKFGDRLVIKYDGYDNIAEKSYWICRCSCGKEERLSTQNVKYSGKCKHNNKRYIDITGCKFGKLTVLKRADNGKWLCECECGTRKLVYSSNLRSGGTTSCKCNLQTKIDKEECIRLLNSFINKYKCKPSRAELEEIFNVSKATVRKYIERFELNDYIDSKFRSKQERYIAKYFIEHSIEIEINNRSIISGYEIDVYIPSRKLAIEFNGNYWHSELYKDKYYHQNKSLECLRNNINIIHIFEYNFDNIDDILDSILNNTYDNLIYIDGEAKNINDIYRLIEDGNTDIEIECPLYNNTIARLKDMGFTIIEICEPKYTWLDNKYNKVVDNILSDEEMYSIGCCKIYDEGSIKMKFEHK